MDDCVSGQGVFPGSLDTDRSEKEDSWTGGLLGLLVRPDGIAKAMNADRAQLGVERLLKIIEENRGASLQESIDGILHQVEAWTGDSPARDDISILAVEFSQTV